MGARDDGWAFLEVSLISSNESQFTSNDALLQRGAGLAAFPTRQLRRLAPCGLCPCSNSSDQAFSWLLELLLAPTVYAAGHLPQLALLTPGAKGVSVLYSLAELPN